MTLATKPHPTLESTRARLKDYIDVWAAMGNPALLHNFVKRNGAPVFPMPRIGEKMKDRMCFQNAAETVFDGLGKYVEGVAWTKHSPIPIHHAWVEVDGRAMDPTWRDPMECEYFGVVFDTDVVREQVLRAKHYGLLDSPTGYNVDLMFRIDPGLELLLPERLRRK